MARFLGIFGGDKPSARQRVEPIFAATPENPVTSLSNPDAWLLDWAGATSGTSFGPPISEQSSMSTAAVFRCVALRAGLVAGLPLKVYQDTPGRGRVEAPSHRIAPFLASTPYPGRSMSAFTWRELWETNVCLWGNHYSIIRYDGAARVVGFEAAMPWQVETVRLVGGARDGQNLYYVNWQHAPRERVLQEDMLHIPGMGFDGIRGLSCIQAFGRPAVALAKVLEQQTGRVHENAARPSGMMELPPNISVPGKAQLDAHFAEQYTGRDNVGKVIYVDKDTKFTPFQMDPADLNTLEFRRYQNADICRIFGVPPHLIGEAAGTSAWGSGIEQLTIGFDKFTLAAMLGRIESELNLKLFFKTPFYARFDREALGAMDAKTSAEVIQIKVQSGRLTPNEARRLDHMPDIKGGDEPLVNSALVALKNALTPPAPPANPPPTGSNKDSAQ